MEYTQSNKSIDKKVLFSIGANWPAPSEEFIRYHLENCRYNSYALIGKKVFEVSQKKQINYNKFLLKIEYYYFKVFKQRRAGFFDIEHFEICKIIKALKISVLVSEYGDFGVENMRIVNYVNIRHIVIFRGGEIHVRKNLQKYKTKYKYLIKEATAVIGVSKEICEVLGQINSLKPIYYLPSGAADDLLCLKESSPRITREILVIARFVEKKNPIGTIIIINEVLKKFPNVNFTVIGSGDFYSSVKLLVKYLEIESNINFIQKLDREEIKIAFENAEICLMNSWTAYNGDKEGTPGFVMESMAAGKAVIASKHGGNIDLIKHGENGFLFNEGNIQEPVELILDVLKNDLLSRQLGQNARRFIMDNKLTKSNNLQKIEELMFS